MPKTTDPSELPVIDTLEEAIAFFGEEARQLFQLVNRGLPMDNNHELSDNELVNALDKALASPHSSLSDNTPQQDRRSVAIKLLNDWAQAQWDGPAELANDLLEEILELMGAD